MAEGARLAGEYFLLGKVSTPLKKFTLLWYYKEYKWLYVATQLRPKTKQPKNVGLDG